MTTTTDNQAFVDEILNEIILPGVDDLLDSRYFRDLRAGKLTTRRLQGFAIQHYIHNMGVLKMAALGATQHAASDKVFMVYAELLDDELTHPAICKRFGFQLGLTEEDFDRAVAVPGPLEHTAVCIAGVFLVTPAELRANGLSNETMVQRYSTELNTYLEKEPYGFDEAKREFFLLHMGADIEHTKRSADAIAAMAPSDEEQEKVRQMCRNMARLKRGKFEGIYDAYA